MRSSSVLVTDQFPDNQPFPSMYVPASKPFTIQPVQGETTDRPATLLGGKIRSVLHSPVDFVLNLLNSTQPHNAEESVAGLTAELAVYDRFLRDMDDGELTEIVIHGASLRTEAENMIGSNEAAIDAGLLRHHGVTGSKPKPILLLGLLALAAGAGATGLWYAARRTDTADCVVRVSLPGNATTSLSPHRRDTDTEDATINQANRHFSASVHTSVNAIARRQNRSAQTKNVCTTEAVQNKCERAEQDAARHGKRFTRLIIKSNQTPCRCTLSTQPPPTTTTAKPVNMYSASIPVMTMQLLFHWFPARRTTTTRAPIESFYWGNNVGILTGIDPAVRKQSR